MLCSLKTSNACHRPGHLLGLTDAHAIYVCGLSPNVMSHVQTAADMDWVYTLWYFCKQTLPLTWERNSAPMLWRSGMAKFVRTPAMWTVAAAGLGRPFTSTPRSVVVPPALPSKDLPEMLFCRAVRLYRCLLILPAYVIITVHVL